MVLVSGWRFAFEWISGRVGPRERLLILGTGAAALTLARELFERRFELGVDIVGFVDPDPERVGTPLINPGSSGPSRTFRRSSARAASDRVVVSLGDAAASCRWTSCSR
jgi:FlaA1/EpsC-like NDP-sugar epimerase